MLPKTQVFIAYFLKSGKILLIYFRTVTDCLAEANDFLLGDHP